MEKVKFSHLSRVNLQAESKLTSFEFLLDLNEKISNSCSKTQIHIFLNQLLNQIPLTDVLSVIQSHSQVSTLWTLCTFQTSYIHISVSNALILFLGCLDKFNHIKQAILALYHFLDHLNHSAVWYSCTVSIGAILSKSNTDNSKSFEQEN